MARKVSDTSRAIDFVLENKDKMLYREIVDSIEAMTKLRRTTIQSLVTKVINNKDYELPTGKDAMNAKEYIRDNFYKCTKEEMIDYILDNTRLKSYSANIMYESVAKEKKAKPKEEVMEERDLYKGRERRFFYFDTSNLWRNV